MTLDELRALGYEFKISGFQYEVIYRKPIKVNVDWAHDEVTLTGRKADIAIHDDIMDFFQYVVPSNLPRHAGKSIMLATGYGAGTKTIKEMQQRPWQFNVPAEVILKGTIPQNNDWRTRSVRRATGIPSAADMKAIWQKCRDAATVDYVKRKLGE